MKKILLFLVFIFGFTNAQFVIEDNNITENTIETGRAAVSFELNNPLEFYRLKCLDARYAQFPGGENAFKAELQKALKNVLGQETYSVNGTFDFILFLDNAGNLKQFQLLPQVQNSDILYGDLKLAVEKINKKWIPATCNGSPIDSKIRLRVNFRTEGFDL